MLLDTSVRLILSNWWVESLIAWVSSKKPSKGDEEELLDRTLGETAELQLDMADNLSNLLIAFVFGLAQPWLLMLMPLAAWFNLCSLSWAEKAKSTDFALKIAQSVLLQPPIEYFRRTVAVLQIVVTLCFFVDLEFEQAPMIVYAVCVPAIYLCDWLTPCFFKVDDCIARLSFRAEPEAVGISVENNPLSPQRREPDGVVSNSR